MDFFRRWRWLLALGVLLAIGLTFALWPASIAVDTAEVERGPMVVGVTDDGVTRAEEYYVVSAPVTGYLSRIELDPGDPVAGGDLLAYMTASASTPLDARTRGSLSASLSAAQATTSALASTLEQARRDLTRAEELSKRGFLPRAQLEAAQTRVTTGQANLAEAQANAARIAAELGNSSGQPSGQRIAIRAPDAGSVMSVITESEGEIMQGTSLVTIGDPQRIEVVIDLLSREAVQVKVGDPVDITGWGGTVPLKGKVKRIEPFGRLKVSALGIEEQRVNVIIGFENPQQAARLGHGYQLDATIVLWSDKNALRVPIGAIFRGGDGAWRTLVAEGGRAHARKIKVGHMNDEFAQITGGLKVGETVILNPSTTLTDGTRVSAR